MNKLAKGSCVAVPRERAAGVLQADLVLEDADLDLRQRPERLHGLHDVAAGMDADEGLAGSVPAPIAARRGCRQVAG